MKIGILGGTFDPVHNGHILIAEHCLKELCLDKVMFLPNGNPPHKRERNITDKIHRYNMLKLALDGYDDFFVSDYEINREEYSYTVETMRHFRASSSDEYILIIGADSFYQLNMWYKSLELVRENSFVVLDREYQGHDTIEEDIENFNKQQSANVSLCRMPVVNISSTMVRERLLSGEKADDIIPRVVADYIRENKLYR